MHENCQTPNKSQNIGHQDSTRQKQNRCPLPSIQNGILSQKINSGRPDAYGVHVRTNLAQLSSKIWTHTANKPLFHTARKRRGNLYN